MNRVRIFALGAALAAVLAGSGAAASSAPPGEAASTSQETQAAKGCSGDINTSGVFTAALPGAMHLASLGPFAPPTKCKCPKKCPIEIPPVSCAPGEKVCKTNATCNFNIICNGQVVACSVKVKVEFCTPKNAPCRG